MLVEAPRGYKEFGFMLVEAPHGYNEFGSMFYFVESKDIRRHHFDQFAFQIKFFEIFNDVG